MSTPVAISGSRSASILGVSPYRTRLEIWLEMMGEEFCKENNYKYEKFEGNDQTAFGSAFEGSICEIVGGITDREKYYEDGYLTCHIDGLKDGMLVENKTTSAQYFYSSFSEKLNRVPISYICQVQHNLYLTGLQKCIMNVLVFPKTVDQMVAEGWHPYQAQNEWLLCHNDIDIVKPVEWVKVLADMGYLKTFIIERDDELIEMMLKEYSTFWNENILGGKMPDPICINDIKQIYTEPFGTVIADETIERLHDERKLITDEIKELTKKADQNKFLIQDYMRQHDGLIDTETREKTVLYSRSGKKLASYDGKVMR